MQAEQLLQSQNYEQSIQLAGASMQSARRIYYAAMQQALMRQMAIAAEQRRQRVRMAAPPWNGVSFGAAAATRRGRRDPRQRGQRKSRRSRPGTSPARASAVVERHGAGELVIRAHQWNWAASSATMRELDRSSRLFAVTSCEIDHDSGQDLEGHRGTI